MLTHFMAGMVSVPDCVNPPRADWPGQLIVGGTIGFIVLVIAVTIVLAIYFDTKT